MNLTEFNRKFGTEKKCIHFIKKQREKQGLTCPKCSKKVTTWNSKRSLWRCSCGRRIYLKSGTMMESTKLPLTTWFKAMFFMTFTKKSLSILELSRLLEIKRYRTVWYLTMKIRMAMSDYVLNKEYNDFILLISADKSVDPNLMGIQNYSTAAVFKSGKRGEDEIGLIAPIELLKNVEIDEALHKIKGYRCIKIFGI